MTVPESAVQRVLLARLNAIPGVWLERTNVGAGRGASGRVIRFGRPGMADSHGSIWGVFAAVEFKSATGRQSPEQVAYQRLVEQNGGIYVLARDIAETEARVRCLADRLRNIHSVIREALRA